MVFSLFPEDTDYFTDDRQAMVNLRVRDLVGLVAQLRASGLEVITKPEWDGTEAGTFARVHDPEGNPVELWQPPSSA